ncbi:MAG TPA: hypothetical protein PKJ78_17710 [Candidatus Hydrogenedentes bacterium]|nr:hypothetical protein [Candidatus Hydrogenedentota bacterium]
MQARRLRCYLACPVLPGHGVARQLQLLGWIIYNTLSSRCDIAAVLERRLMRKGGMMPRSYVILVLAAVLLTSVAFAQTPEPVAIGSNRELFVDGYLIGSLQGAALRLHAPVTREAVLRYDKPWEGSFCGYNTLINDGEKYMLFYRGLPVAGADGSENEVTCVALSVDGVHFAKPSLGLYEVHGTRENNVILADDSPFSHNFTPFLDANPDAAPAQRFKAVAGTSKTGLHAFISQDGIHWEHLRGEPILSGGAYDSQNLVFWSKSEQCYVCYFRIFVDGVRSVSRTTSKDFLNWAEATPMTFGNTPMEHLYTNQTQPYFRAPHIYVATPARFMPGRKVIPDGMAERMGANTGYVGDCSDTVFMSTRGGNVYDRTFMESFVRPGFGLENWTSRTNYTCYGIIPTGPATMSFYIQRNYAQPSQYLQRLELRIDGFASINAGYSGGEFITKPLTFAGKELELNFATSAAGSVWVELQQLDGTTIPGFTKDECDEIIGDQIDRVVSWKGNTDVSAWAGKPVRLRFVMKDADLFAIRFRE